MTGENGATPTDWSQHTLSEIWGMLAPESDAGHVQAQVWYQIEKVCRTHADQLAAATVQLAAAWPPTKGSAAESFHNFVTQLIASMRLTSSAAYNNGLTLESFHDALLETRSRIEGLVKERDEHLASGNLKDGYAALADGGWREKLAAQAHNTMATSDATAQLSASLVQTPSSYGFGNSIEPRVIINGPTEPGDGTESNGAGGQVFGASSSAPFPPVSSTAMPESGDVQPVLAGSVESRPARVPQPNGENASPASAMAPRSDITLPEGTGVTPPARSFVPGVPGGQVIGGTLGGPQEGSETRSGSARAGYGTAPALGGEAGGHGAIVGGGIMGGMPMMAGGRPAVTRDGTRIGRPGEVIGGGRGKRRRPDDPDDPWAPKIAVVAPVIGEPEMADLDPQAWDGLPPGVVSIEGWPR